MKSLEELLAAWEQGTLTPAEREDLKRQLASPEARAQLVDDWLLQEAVYDALRSRPAQATAPAEAAGAPRLEPVGRSWRARFLPRLVWREVRIPLRWQVGFALSLCLLMAGWFFYCQQSALGQLEDVQASVVVERSGRRFVAQVGQRLYPGDILRVPVSGAAALAWAGEATRLDCSPGTELQLLNPLRGKRCSLRAGGLQATVAPQPHWRPLILRTPQAEVRVVGTMFSLAVTGATTRLEVLEGAVRFRKMHSTAVDRALEVLVRAGEKAAVEPGSPLAVQLLTGFLSSDVWAVSSGTPLAEAPSRGALLRAPERAGALGRTNCVERLRGYLYPRASGEFTFWVASFNGSAAAELWLSSDENPEHKQRIAYLAPPGSQGAPTGADRRRAPGAALDLTWSPSQKSVPQALIQGRRYYLEVWHEGGNIGSLAIRWRTPGEPETSAPRMVDLDALCPFVESAEATAWGGKQGQGGKR